MAVKKMKSKWAGLLAGLAILGTAAAAEVDLAAVSALADQEYDFAAPRTPGMQYWVVTTTMTPYSLEGTREPKVIFGLKLKGGIEDGKEAYSCVETTLKVGDAAEVTIPSLAGWSYVFGEDDGSRTLGIPHEPFTALVDSTGTMLPPQLMHPVYNQFIDFHAFCDSFGRPAGDAPSIKHLEKVGDTVLHNAAGTKPRIELGDIAGEGSYFQNGQVTLTFKGLTVIDGAPCAVIGYDSGESSLEMHLEAAPGMKLDIVGTSHYFGDIVIDLSTMWVRKADMMEFVVTNVMMGGEKVGGQPFERAVVIEAVTAEEFEEA